MQSALVYRILFMLNGDESDSRGFKDVQGIHEGAPHDAEDVLGVVGHQGLDEGLAGSHIGRGVPPCRNRRRRSTKENLRESRNLVTAEN